MIPSVSQIHLVQITKFQMAFYKWQILDVSDNLYPCHMTDRSLYPGVRYVSVSRTLGERFVRLSCVALPFYPVEVRYSLGYIR